MNLSFYARESLESSDDADLDSILSECELEAEIMINCELGRHAEFNHIKVEGLAFHSHDSGEIKQLDLGVPIMEAIKKELSEKVKKKWACYEREAFNWAMAIDGEAIERRHEEQKESCYHE